MFEARQTSLTPQKKDGFDQFAMISQAQIKKNMFLIFCSFTCGFCVSTWAVKSHLTQSRWTSESCSATEVTRWTQTTAKQVCQMQTETTIYS